MINYRRCVLLVVCLIAVLYWHDAKGQAGLHHCNELHRSLQIVDIVDQYIGFFLFWDGGKLKTGQNIGL